MQKNIVSLMLFDDILEAVDREAYLCHTNRSQLINDILAEHFGLQTPEQKIRSVLMELEQNFADTLSIGQVVGNSIQFGKSIKYKYRPKLRYAYEFVGSGSEKYAVLKVTSRTTNQRLNDHLNHFFNMISEMEQKQSLTEGCCGNEESNAHFVKEFKQSGEMSRDAESISDHLTRYLSLLDTALNTYFSDLDDQEGFEASLNQLYTSYILSMK